MNHSLKVGFGAAIGSLAAIALLLIAGCQAQPQLDAGENTSKDKAPESGGEGKEGFCGSSSYGSCSGDAECRTGGCSGQACESVNDEQLITTCEYRDCYNAEAYGLSCRCIESVCRWGVKDD